MTVIPIIVGITGTDKETVEISKNIKKSPGEINKPKEHEGDGDTNNSRNYRN